MEVVVLRWPAGEARRQRLRAAGVPRLLLVDASAAAPAVEDDLEDWTRAPTTDADLRARIDALGRRARARSVAGDGVPDLDGDGVLRYGGAWVALPPVDARLAEALLERLGAVVSRDALARAGWPAGAPGRNALDVHILRLRRRLTPLSLTIRTVRARGYLLEVPAAETAPAGAVSRSGL
jgi:DNA-binding response OmpR family regulator